MVALAETGVVGALLLGAALVCPLLAALPDRRATGLGGAAAGAGVLMFGYWLAHGSLDRFWEFPGLAGAALAGLGVGIAVARTPGAGAEPAAPLLRGWRALAVAGAGAALLAVSIVPPWLSDRERERAIDVAGTHPDEALDRLDRAANLNPLSLAPYKTAALVEIRRGHYDAAARELRRAFERDSDDPDLYLLLGLAESELGRPRQALSLVAEARRLAPRDDVAPGVLRELRRAGRLDPLRLDPWTRADYRRRIALD
jgi:Tetratricopeptide repeat